METCGVEDSMMGSFSGVYYVPYEAWADSCFCLRHSLEEPLS